MMQLSVGQDTLPIRTEAIGYTDGGGASRETVRKYNIVVGQFKQVFNARQMRERLMAGGYPDAFIVPHPRAALLCRHADRRHPEEASPPTTRSRQTRT